VPDNESVNIFVYEVVAVIFLIHIFTSSVNCVFTKGLMLNS
jgi:hypothetical protein